MSIGREKLISSPDFAVLLIALTIFYLFPRVAFSKEELKYNLVQITECYGWLSSHPCISDDGRSIAFLSKCDLTGHNQDHNSEAFIYRDGKITQQTFTQECETIDLSMDAKGSRLAFSSTCDLAGQNEDFNTEIFIMEQDGLMRQITNTRTFRNDSATLDNLQPLLAFRSYNDFTEKNADHSSEIFIADLRPPEPEITQLSDGKSVTECAFPSIGSGFVAFQCNADMTGENSDASMEIFIASPGGAPLQLTKTSGCINQWPAINRRGSSVVFQSSCNLTGKNLNHYFELFMAEGRQKIKQLTHGQGEGCWSPSLNAKGDMVVFTSRQNVHSANRDHTVDVFIMGLSKNTGWPEIIYDLKAAGAETPAVDATGRNIVFVSAANPKGKNLDGSVEVFLATLAKEEFRVYYGPGNEKGIEYEELDSGERDMPEEVLNGASVE